MEDRTLLAQLLVTNGDDIGRGTLRQAILDANAANLYSSTIDFAIPGPGVHTIALDSALPNVAATVLIDGTSQPGYAGAPLIELDGQNAGLVNGLTIVSSDTTVRGLCLGGFGFAGIAIIGPSAAHDQISSNYIGIDPSGTVALPNGMGVRVAEGANDNVIGGTDPGLGNLIADSLGSGLVVAGDDSLGNEISGNRILSSVPGGLHFTGLGGHAVVPDDPGLRFSATQSFTVTTWVDIATLPGEWSAIFDKSRDQWPWYGIWIDPTNHWVAGGTSNLPGPAVTVGRHFLALVQDASAGTRTLYVDGVNVADAAAQAGDGTGDLWIGGSPSVGEFSSFTIESLQIWSEARSAGQILADMAALPTGLQPGLAADYQFDESSGQTVHDSSPNHRDGSLVAEGGDVPVWNPPAIDLGDDGITPNSPEAHPGPGNTGLEFDGRGSYVQLPSFPFGGPFTFEAWVESDNVYASWARVFDFGNGPGAQELAVNWNATDGTLGMGIQDPDGNWTGLGTSQLFPQGTWVHVAVTVDDQGQAVMYWNGVEMTTGSVAVPPVLTRAHMYLGRSNWPDDAPLAGAMHDVAIWSEARTADQIKIDTTNPPTGSEAGLVAYYPLNNIAGLTAADKGPHHYDAVIVIPQPGPNHFQSYPAIVTAADGEHRGWLGDCLPNATYRVELFASAGYGPGDAGRAETYLGALSVTTDGSGSAVFDVPFTAPADEPVITATATDATGNTSELSARRHGIFHAPAQFVRLVPGQPLVFSAAAGDGIALADAGAGPLDPAWDLALSVPLGTLTLSTTAGLVGSGNGTGTLDYRGALSAINAALDGLTYSPPAGFSGKVSLTVSARSDGAAPLTAGVRVTDGTFRVTTTNDSSPGTLRQAILDASDTPGPTAITFAIPGNGVQVIAPTSPLPAITTSVLIDGFSQPGYAGSPLVELSGAAAGIADGLTIQGSGATVRGLIIGNFAWGAGIVIDGQTASGNLIEANAIGTDPTATQLLPNNLGVRIADGAHDNTVGGTDPGHGNLIAFNYSSDVVVAGDASVDNRLSGNRVLTRGLEGTAFDGSKYVQLPNDLIRTYEHAETIEAWFQTTSGGAILGYQTTDPSTTPSGSVPILYVGTDGKLYGELWSGSVNQVVSDRTVSDGRWHHVALVVNGDAGNESLYLDGRFVGSIPAVVQDFGGSVNQIGIGDTRNRPAAPYGWFPFKGQIREVRIWSVDRAADQVAADIAGATDASASGLEAYYQLDQTSGTVVTDLSPNHRDGRVVNSAPTNAPNKAIDLGADGTTQNASGTWQGPGGTGLRLGDLASYVQLPSFPLGGPLTIEAWVESNVIFPAGSMIFDSGDAPGSNELLLGSLYGDYLEWPGGSDNNGEWQIFPSGQWVHVAATIDDQGNAVLYWNGEQVGAMSVGGAPPVLSRAHQYLGSNIASPSGSLDGALRDVSFWSGARTPDQIRLDMTASLSWSEPGLIAYYPLNSASGLVARDFGPNHYDGTIVRRPGPNYLQNYPVVVTTADGHLSDWLSGSLPDTEYRIELFASASAGGDGKGQAETFLGTVDAVTDDNGQAVFDTPFTVPADRPFITATATDPEGNTSELSSLLPRPTSVDTPAQLVRMSAGQPAVFSAATGDGIVLHDPVAGPLDPAWDLTLTASVGSLTLSSLDGLSGGGDGTGTLHYHGGLKALNAALEGMAYEPATGSADSVVVSIDAQSPGAAPLHGQITLSDGVFHVTTTADNVPGSLRQAILDAENTLPPGPDTIEFAIPGDGVQTIAPLWPLPPLTTSILIDGFSQPGYAGSPLIELSGANVSGGDGLTITGSGATIRGLAIGGFGTGIVITGQSASQNWIYANQIGTDASGGARSPNSTGIGIEDGAHDNTIGGTDPGLGNLLGFNLGSGVVVQGDGSVHNRINGNRFLTAAGPSLTAAGTLALDGSGYLKLPDNLIRNSENEETIEAWFQTSSGGVILGYQTPDLSGNYGVGVPLLYVGSDGLLRGDFYSQWPLSPATSAAAVNDGRWHDVALVADSYSGSYTLYLDGQLVGSTGGLFYDVGASLNQIGTGYTTDGSNGNWPATSGGWYPFAGQIHDVKIWNEARTASQVQADMTGTSPSDPGLLAYYPLSEGSGTTAYDATANHRDATLYTSTQAIDLGGDGVTYNAPSPRQGPNNLQNYPTVVRTADGRLRGWLSGSLPDTTFRIELFASAARGPSSSAQAQAFLGSVDARTDETGQVVFDIPFAAPADLPFVTATTTDPEGNTSELSPLRRARLAAPVQLFRITPGEPRVFSAAVGDGISVLDPDSGPLDAAWDLTLTTPSGLFNLSSLSGLVGSGDGTGTLHYEGSLSALNAALDGLQYVPAPNAPDRVVTSLDLQSEGAAPIHAELTMSDGVFTVTNTADNGPGSLRQAILDAENTFPPGLDTMDFAIPGTGVQTIAPLTPLPAVTTSTLIDGFSQPGYAGSPLIELSGQSAGVGNGLTLMGSGSTVRGLAIDGFASGAAVVVRGPSAAHNWIYSNVLGTDPSDPAFLPNANGVVIRDGAHDNTVGGVDPAAGNLISGNTGSGVLIPSAGVDWRAGFADTQGQLALNGSASIYAGTLALTDGGNNEAGSAFTTQPMDITRFATRFQLEFGDGGHGVTFAIQGNGPSAMGDVADGLGYSGISTSVAVKFDISDDGGGADGTTGLYVDGASPMGAGSIDLVGTGINLHTGDILDVAMSYDGAALAVTISDASTGASASQKYAVDIAGRVGGPRAFVGFTGATGSESGAHEDILGWNFSALAADPVDNRIEGNRIITPQGPPMPSAGALQLDGGGYLMLPHDLIRAHEQGETIEARFQTTSGGVILGYQSWSAFSQPGTYIPALYVGTDGRLYGAFDGFSQIASVNTVNDGAWHQVALVIDGAGQTLRLYLDGLPAGSATGSPSDLYGSFSQIGTGFTGNGYPNYPGTNGGWYSFQGEIADVQIWSVARSADQIGTDLNANPSGAEQGLVAYFPFSQGEGATAYDATPNHRDAVRATNGAPDPAWVAYSAKTIDLGGDGVTYNAASPRQGPNNLQNYPIVVATADGHFRGWLAGSLPNSSYHLEFFASARSAADGSGEAEVFLGSLEVTTDAGGQAVFDVPYTPPAEMPVVTATATDPAGNTSEVSALRRTAITAPTGIVRFDPGGSPALSSSAGNAVVVQDPDAGPLVATWDVSLSVPSGTLALSTTAGLVGSGNGTSTLSYRGGIEAINAALDGLLFSPAAGFHGKFILSINAQSEGAQPLGAQVTLSDGVYAVTTTADNGPGSLRKAILDATATPGPCSVIFAVPGAGTQTVMPASALPDLPAGITIDGTTQPGYAGTPLIELDGQNAGAASGLTIKIADTTVRGLAIDGFASGPGILISGPAATGTLVQANFIGTDPTGTQERPNGTGIAISGNARDNTIGGTDAGAGNLIADNAGPGIVVTDPGTVGNRIEGNRIFANEAPHRGLEFDGSGSYVQLPSFPLGGAMTVEAWVKSDNVYASYARVFDFGAPFGGSNIIAYWYGTSGQMGFGVNDQYGGWNYIETNAVFPQARWVQVAATVDGDGHGAIYWDGQQVASGFVGIPPVESRPNQYVARSNWSWDSAFTGSIDDVQIWSVARNAAEIQADGAYALVGNEPGLVAYYNFNEGQGTTAYDATANHRDATLATTGVNLPVWAGGSDGLAIDLGGDGPTENAPAPRQGPNNLQNYPIVVPTADGHLKGWLDGSLPDSAYHVEFFAGARYGQAEVYLGSVEVTTDGSGQAIFDVPYTPTADNPFVSATATDPDGNTSELSASRQTGLTAPTTYERFAPGSSLAFSSGAGDSISLQEPDAGPLDPAWDVTLSAPSRAGTLSFSTLAGLTGTGNGTTSLNYRGGIVELNQALQGLQFKAAAGFPGKIILMVGAQPLGLAVIQAQLTVGDGVYPVVTTADGGDGSLRKAIIEANATPGPASITFAIPGSGIETIYPATALPAITNAVVIDGTTQPGYSGDPVVVIAGSAVDGSDSLSISGVEVTLRGVSASPVAFTAASASSILRLEAVPVANSGESASGGREHSYCIRAATGGELVALVHPSGATLRLSLLDSQSRLLVQSDGATASNPDSVIDQFVPPGSYTIAIKRIGGSGAYDLTASLLANATGTFPNVNHFATGDGPTSPVVGDFNGDGRLDLAVLNARSHDISLLFGNGDGTFQHERRIPVPGNTPLTMLIAGDFNGDGRLDLVTNGTILLGNGDGTFQAHSFTATGDILAAGDFTGHGTLDLLDLSPTSLGLLVGRGDGTFFPERQIAPESPYDYNWREHNYYWYYPYVPRDSLAVGDFSGDGRLDVAIPTPSAGVAILLGNGDGTFQPARQQTDLGAWDFVPLGLIPGDFYHDGRIDLLVYGYRYEHNLRVFTIIRNAGGGYFQPSGQFFPLVAMPEVAADFNGDGSADLALSSGVSLGSGDGGVSASPQSFPSGFSAQSLIAGDFEGDGRLDLAGVNSSSNSVSVLLGAGDGTFSEPNALSVSVHDSPLLADFAGDGTRDLVAIDARGQVLFRRSRPNEPGTFDPPIKVNPGNPARDIAYVMTDQGPMLAAVDAGDDAVSIYRDLAGTFVRVASLPTGHLPAQIAAADLTGNGLDDLVIRNASDGTLTLYLGEKLVGPAGAGYDVPNFVPGASLLVGLGVSDLSLADTTGRGMLDIVATNKMTGEVSVLLNRGGGSFDPSVPYRAGTGPAWLGTSQDGSMAVASGEATSDVAAGKFTPNGLIDLVTVNPGTNTIGMLAGLGQGRFANPLAMTTASPPQMVRVADFNHDGIPDLAVLTQSGVSVYLGDGKGGFSASVTYETGPDPTGLSIADVNHDGNLDLLVGNTHGDVLILLNQGNGTFLPYRKTDQAITLAVADLTGNGSKDVIYADQGLDRVVVAYGQGRSTVLGDRSTGVLAPGAVKLADLNGDGIPDLIVANSGSNNVLIYPGLGNGQFGPALNGGHGFFTGENPVEVTVADVNSDGRLDLIVANKGSNDVSILLNQPDGSGFTFTPGPRLAAGAGPVDTIVQDILGNGKPDLLVSDSQSNSVMLLPGIGGGFFSQAQARTFAVGSQPGPIFLGNFDGKPDLVTVNAGSNDLTLFSNFTADNSVTVTIPSGGLDPVTAFAFSGTSGFDDLVVANNGDGALALFEGGPEGLTLFSTDTMPELPSPTALAFAALSGGQVQFYAATEGRESAVLVELTLTGESGLPSAAGALSPSIPENVAQLVPVSESSLALVGSLLIVTLESPASELSVSSAEIAAATGTGALAAGPGAVGQSLVVRGGNELGEGTGDLELGQAEQPSTAIAPAKTMSWERFVLGIDEALERYDREHQEKAPSAPTPGRESSPAPKQREAGSAAPAGSPVTDRILPDEGQRAEALDEAIELLFRERGQGDESIPMDAGWGVEVTFGLTSKDAIEVSKSSSAIAGPRVSSRSRARARPQLGSDGASASRDRESPLGALILGAMAAGWAHDGLRRLHSQVRLPQAKPQNSDFRRSSLPA
jgi:hypothetical protein